MATVEAHISHTLSFRHTCTNKLCEIVRAWLFSPMCAQRTWLLRVEALKQFDNKKSWTEAQIREVAGVLS